MAIRSLYQAVVLLFAAVSLPSVLAAQSVPVRKAEGTLHGFLALRSQEGKLLAVGDLVETVRGSVVTNHLVYRFKDGSVDDETTMYTQRGHFQLISDRHIQSGPSFPHPLDLRIDLRRGQITSHATGKDGQDDVQRDPHLLPPDLGNGMVLAIAKNLSPDTPQTVVPMLVAAPKLRLVKLVITPRGEDPFTVLGAPRKAMRFEIRIDLGGVAGVVAPLIGKQPPDIQIWIIEGPAPGFVKEEGPFFQGGPVWTVELASPSWPDPTH